MLFLLNEQVLDIGVPYETLAACGAPDSLRPPSMAQILAGAQDAAFAGRGLEHAHETIRLTLAARLGVTGRVNCALIYCPPKARSAREVAVRLALAPITTLSYLQDQQRMGRLNAALINREVWRLAGGAPAA